MKEFILIFRLNSNSDSKPSPEQVQQRKKWLENITTQNKLADRGNTLSPKNTKIVKSENGVTEGPYAESGEFVSGYMIVKTRNINEAVELAKGNPIFRIGGNVEIREVVNRSAAKTGS